MNSEYFTVFVYPFGPVITNSVSAGVVFPFVVFTIHKLPIPKNPVCITLDELNSLEFEEGEDTREEGERLAASYVNFYITNDGILLPQFNDENDEIAVNMMQKLFPTRKIYPIYARPIIVGGGNIHCITQQIPLGNRK